MSCAASVVANARRSKNIEQGHNRPPRVPFDVKTEGSRHGGSPRSLNAQRANASVSPSAALRHDACRIRHLVDANASSPVRRLSKIGSIPTGLSDEPWLGPPRGSGQLCTDNA